LIGVGLIVVPAAAAIPYTLVDEEGLIDTGSGSNQGWSGSLARRTETEVKSTDL